MTDICPIVVIGFSEGKVDKVVNDEVNAEEQDDKGRKDLLVHGSHVKSYTHTV